MSANPSTKLHTPSDSSDCGEIAASHSAAQLDGDHCRTLEEHISYAHLVLFTSHLRLCCRMHSLTGKPDNAEPRHNSAHRQRVTPNDTTVHCSVAPHCAAKGSQQAPTHPPS